MKFKLKHIFPVFCTVILLLTSFLTSCNDEMISTDKSKKLAFSTDTLTFDTVFSTLGSATKKFLIYNRNNQALNISSIALSNGKNSAFRINVDGMVSESNSFTNVEIPAKDSLYVFVEVTVDPTSNNNPVLVSDSLLFTTNGNAQHVRFEAFGQDVYFLKNATITSNSTLKADKPYLIYGNLVVDSAKTLTIPAGCRLYFHNNANLIVNGNLRVNGTPDNQVYMQGDRMDKIVFDHPIPYQFVAGQWGGVYLLWSGATHSINYLNLRSGYVGLYFINNDRFNLPSMTLTNSRITNFVYYGLAAQNANVLVANSEISNTGSYTVYLSGGKHQFIQSTIANYMDANDGAPVSRDKSPAVLLNDMSRNAPMLDEFINCVIAGSLQNELSIATRFPDKFDATFVNCYIRKKNTETSSQYSNIKWYSAKDTIFKHPSYDYKKGVYFNFMPDSVSPLRGLADKSIATQYPIDLNGNNRLKDNNPDAGAYEWVSTVNK